MVEAATTRVSAGCLMAAGIVVIRSVVIVISISGGVTPSTIAPLCKAPPMKGGNHGRVESSRQLESTGIVSAPRR